MVNIGGALGSALQKLEDEMIKEEIYKQTIIGCKSSSWGCLCVDCSSPRGSEECREFREHNKMSEDWVE